MNEANKERLSAFMDDEIEGLDKNQVEQLLKDPDMLDTWSRYHLVSDALRRNLPEHLDRDLAGRISGAIEREPAIVAPGVLSRSFARPVAGFAIAASVAALAIFGIQQQQPAGPHDMPPDTLVQSVPAPGGAGSIQAPVRQVSAGSGTAAADCERQAGEDAGAEPDRGRGAAAGDAGDGQDGVNCP